tara:strand:- start:320 stop:565 length:246 start_codon:yes stop_codon:yes gene_type:complete
LGFFGKKIFQNIIESDLTLILIRIGPTSPKKIPMKKKMNANAWYLQSKEHLPFYACFSYPTALKTVKISLFSVFLGLLTIC